MGTPINTDRDNAEDISVEIVCEILGEVFGFPCNYSPMEEQLHSIENGIEWCEKNCGKAEKAECWKQYFQLKFDERRC